VRVISLNYFHEKNAQKICVKIDKKQNVMPTQKQKRSKVSNKTNICIYPMSDQY